jgi:hypothetical protein
MGQDAPRRRQPCADLMQSAPDTGATGAILTRVKVGDGLGRRRAQELAGHVQVADVLAQVRERVRDSV